MTAAGGGGGDAGRNAGAAGEMKHVTGAAARSSGSVSGVALDGIGMGLRSAVDATRSMGMHMSMEGSGGRRDKALRGIRGRDGGEDGRGKTDAHKAVQLLRAESVNSYPQWPVGYILS